MTFLKNTNSNDSYITIPSALLKDPEIDHSTAVLLAVIASLSAKDGFCWASDNFLANECKCKPRMISYRLKILEKNGHIIRQTYKEGMLNKRKIFVKMDFYKKKKKEAFLPDSSDKEPEIQEFDTGFEFADFPEKLSYCEGNLNLPSQRTSPIFMYENSNQFIFDAGNTTYLSQTQKKTDITYIISKDNAQFEQKNEFRNGFSNNLYETQLNASSDCIFLKNRQQYIETTNSNTLRKNNIIANNNKLLETGSEKVPKKEEAFSKIKIFDCLEKVDITEKDKIRISKKYSKERVEYSVKYVTHPLTKIKTTPIQILTWCCGLPEGELPKIPESKEDVISKNMNLAKKVEQHLSHSTLRFEALSKHLEIYHVGANSVPTTLKYTEHGFIDQLKSILYKLGFTDLKFLEA